ncbi:MAG: TIGR01906 family membrane protein [Lachnoclostridium sp.]
MKKADKIIATAAMIFLIIALLLTSFQVAIYGDKEYKFYEKEYAKYEVTEELVMTMEDVMDVTEKMMAYLIGEREELSVMTTVEGKEQDFFNEQDRLHMADVKNLFLGGLKLRWILLAAAVVLVFILLIRKVKLREILSGAYFRALAICGSLTVILGILFSSDFNTYFTIFHEIFFTNDLWLFDPETDYMIRMLPEGFFYDMVMRIGLCFIIGLVLLTLLFWMLRRKKNKDSL